MRSIEEIVKHLESNPIEKSGSVYHPIPFPEFSNLSVSSNSKAVYDKWNLIKSATDELFNKNLEGKSVLDIGANAGFYTFSLSKLGANLTSFEKDPNYNEIAMAINNEKNTNVTWFESAFDKNKIKGKKFDLCLMLSVFQWMAEGGTKMDYAINSLKAISEQSEYLIFELSFNKGKSCLKTNKLNHYGAMLSLLRENSSYKSFKLLGKTKLWNNGKRYLILCSKQNNLQDSFPYSLLSKIQI